ncbi:MAG: (2Fe-2S)-binding protein [SAR324 cluster bacterium]|nr:(2Fe-2S)-binding protein [SAR324 cluster bacterium]
MFKKLPQNGEKVSIDFEGKRLETVTGQTVAAALLGSGEMLFRESAVTGQPRSVYCMMGVCFECLLEIDGKPNQQSCMILVQEGMKIRRQQRPIMENHASA